MRRVLSISSIISLIAAGWIGLSALVMVLTDAAPGAIVILPPDRLLRALPEGAAITSVGAMSVTVSVAPGRTRALYAAGAWLVLPAGLTGCLQLSGAPGA